MYASQVASDMKIFTTNVAAVDAGTATATTATLAQQQQQQQQQREYRQRYTNGSSPTTKASQVTVKFNKYNNKTANLLRQVTKFHNGNTTENKNMRTQQQQQQQQQQMHYTSNNHNSSNTNTSSSSSNNSNSNSNSNSSSSSNSSNSSSNSSNTLARKKYYSHNNSNNNNNSGSNLQQHQQQSPPYYQQYQLNSSNNNNNLQTKNQNIIHRQLTDCKLADSNNNNNNNNNSNTNNSNATNKMNNKTNKWLHNNSNKKRNSFSSSTESTTSSYYRSCSESSNPTTTTAATTATGATITSTTITTTAPTTTKTSAATTKTTATVTPATAETSSKAETNKQPLPVAQNTESQQNGGKPPSTRQQPLCFWKTNYPQQPTSQQKEQQLEAALANQKEVAAAAAAAAAAAEQQQQSMGYDQRRNNSNYQQQQHCYSYYYPQPKQLTIASFLQKELLPENNTNSNISNTSNHNNYTRQQQHSGSGYQQQQHQQQQQQQQQQQRYRTNQYAYQQYPQHVHQQHGQQQQTHQHHLGNSHFRRKHGCTNGGPNSSNAVNKKVHFTASNGAGPGGDPGSNHQQPVDILSSNNLNTLHRRAQHGTGKNTYYSHHYHPLIDGGVSGGRGASGGTGATGLPRTSPSAEHQHFYNLTYVNVDGTGSTTGGGHLTGGVSTPTTSKPSLLLMKPTISVNKATTPPPSVLPPNMFVPPPPAPQPPSGVQLTMLLHSPVPISSPTPTAVTLTPSNMISCAQLDEAITTAAAASHSQTGEQPPNGSNYLQQPPPPLPHLISSNNHQQQQPQIFFGFSEATAAPPPPPPPAIPLPPSSPCYGTGLRSVSPASSTCSQDQHRNRLASLSPAQLSPHLGEMNAALHPFGVQAPRQLSVAYPHPLPLPQLPHHHPHYCSPHSPATLGPSPTAWYELILPPDRYLTHSRNMELVTEPEQLICHCKYDNLSSDIWQRFRGSQQTHKKFKLKMRLWRHLFLWINPMFARYRICLVGSTITGFGTDSSDIDMCLLPEHPHPHPHPQSIYSHGHHSQPLPHHEQRAEALIILNLFHSVLKNAGEFYPSGWTPTGLISHAAPSMHAAEVFQDFNLIEARVPILRFRDALNDIEVDLNYNNSVGIKNTYLLQLYAQLDWRTRPLVVVVKLWAQYHDINDAKRMTIPSYSLVLMVLHYLQYGCVPHVLPCLHALYPEKFQLGQQDCLDLDLIEPIEPYQTLNKQTLGEHLLGFFQYYSQFDFRNHAISVRTGGILPVNACRLVKAQKNDIHQWKELNIEEPFDLSNTARSVYDYATFERVKAIFVATAHRLEHTLDLSSIFTPIHYQQPQQHQHQHQHPHQHQQQNHHHQMPTNHARSVGSATVTASGLGGATTTGTGVTAVPNLAA